MEQAAPHDDQFPVLREHKALFRGFRRPFQGVVFLFPNGIQAAIEIRVIGRQDVHRYPGISFLSGIRSGHFEVMADIAVSGSVGHALRFPASVQGGCQLCQDRPYHVFMDACVLLFICTVRHHNGITRISVPYALQQPVIRQPVPVPVDIIPSVAFPTVVLSAGTGHLFPLAGIRHLCPAFLKGVAESETGTDDRLSLPVGITDASFPVHDTVQPLTGIIVAVVVLEGRVMPCAAAAAKQQYGGV